MKWLDDLEIEEHPETVKNKYSGKECVLVPVAVAVYDLIMGCEVTKNWKLHAQALKYFRETWPAEYYILLD